MVEIVQRGSRRGTVTRLLSMPLMQRLVGWAGLALIAGGYVLIMGSADLPEGDVQAAARVVGVGMTLVIVGGVIEVLVLLGWSRS